VITVVFDTNIFISAFEFGGVPRDAFLLAFTEIRRRLERLCTVVEPTERITDCSDPDDNSLECAVAAHAGYIVTGDHALLRLNPFRNIRILTAAQFLGRKPWVMPVQEE
jgi:predicted nucleic acid-binding protein